MKQIQNKELLHEKLIEFQFEHMFTQIEQVPFKLLRFEKGEVILLEGMEMDSLLFLVEGKVKITASVGNGKSLLLRFSHPFSIIGDIELIQHVPVQSQVEAINQCVLIGLSFTYIKQHEMDNPKLLQKLLAHVSYKLQTCTTASRVNLLASVENRFASYLLSTKLEDNNQFAVELITANIEEIANLLGTTYRHLNRVIHSFVQKNIIVKDKSAIQIINVLELEKIAQGIHYE